MKLIDIDALGLGRCNTDAFTDEAYAIGWNSVISMLEEAPALDIEKLYHEKMNKKSSAKKKEKEKNKRTGSDISPCPFCLSKAKMRAKYDRTGISVWVECEGCHIQTQSYYPQTDNEETLLDNLERCEQKAAEDWNKRMRAKGS